MHAAKYFNGTDWEWCYGFHYQITAEGKDYDYIFWQGNSTPVDGRTVCKLWIQDDKGHTIQENDIRVDSDGREFRIYNFDGVFCIKAHYWMSDISDLKPADELVLEALVGQPRAFVLQSTTHVRNLYDNKY